MTPSTATPAGPRARAALAAFLALAVALVVIAPLASALEGPDPVGVWPLAPDPEVVATFDPPDSAYGAGHRGVDLAARSGQPVRAALAGTVTFAGTLAGRGVVVVGHGPTRTTYEPVTATVALGESVARGGRIGTLQLPGSHCFPRACLHWGWIEGETYLDPLRLVGGGPVRLLPLWRDLPVVGPREAPILRAGPAPFLVAPPTWPSLLQLLRHWSVT
ncbi:hypothetical protein NPS01_06080 [Nocardioides psychrotolerans]|uniref:Peptidase family M23 n=1 Tax=Nocardioides psychrotolerans TaxID=1005945 RepID=A0A1I3CX53_9ACTN|nr:peptidoglycan DD-metalloendopeptidase family protein [Nocardioides psychrotolerans]GEP36945.1 hypothetical protein NPS01_06080 [Nocardioides psychrotolerans]SFH79104.1 Peptidase family M23 [Nocardioides psychrotolerans]